MGLGFMDTVTGLGLLETTTGLEPLAVGTGLELFPTVTGLFSSGLETLLAETLVTAICVGLLPSV